MGARLVNYDEKWETSGKYLYMLAYQNWRTSRQISEFTRGAAEWGRREGCLLHDVWASTEKSGVVETVHTEHGGSDTNRKDPCETAEFGWR